MEELGILEIKLMNFNLVDGGGVERERRKKRDFYLRREKKINNLTPTKSFMRITSRITFTESVFPSGCPFARTDTNVMIKTD